jgi:hypothetical protein
MQLAVACRKVSRRAIVAWHKKNIFREIVTQGKCELRHELAADRNMTSRAGVARRKGNFLKKYSTMVNSEQET